VARWQVSTGSPDGVSVSHNCNVVVAVRDTGHVVIFNSTGQLVKDIRLPVELFRPRHAFQLPGRDELVLCHGWGTSAYGICVVDANGRLVKSASSSAAAAGPAGDAGSPRPKSFSPTHLAVDGRGHVLAAEFDGCSVQLYSKDLEYVSDVVDDSAGLQQPFRLCVDHRSGRLYVGEYGGQARVVAFDR